MRIPVYLLTRCMDLGAESRDLITLKFILSNCFCSCTSQNNYDLNVFFDLSSNSCSPWKCSLQKMNGLIIMFGFLSRVVLVTNSLFRLLLHQKHKKHERFSGEYVLWCGRTDWGVNLPTLGRLMISRIRSPGDDDISTGESWRWWDLDWGVLEMMISRLGSPGDYDIL